ncbi:hypothetical protein H4582DRAFT_1107831 [Lactarius indigo]|nr:hypothetical protein H4582DRAFT_1107831 [Lactarius indigo]
MTPMIPFPTVDPDQPLLWYCTSNFLRPFETYKTSGSQKFIVGNRQPPERLRCSTLKRISAFCGVPVDGTYRTCPADSRPLNCVIVKGEGIPEQKWSKRKILMAPPPTMRSVSFFLSCLRSSNTLPPHVAEILLHMLVEVLMKAYNHSKFNTTSEFTKVLVLISSHCGSPSSPALRSLLAYSRLFIMSSVVGYWLSPIKPPCICGRRGDWAIMLT